MTTFYEYDAQGWYSGWHENPNHPNILNCTTIPPAFLPSRARWNGTGWYEDLAREQAQIASESDTLTRRQQAIAFLRAFDPNIATAADVKIAVAAIIRLLPTLTN